MKNGVKLMIKKRLSEIISDTFDIPLDGIASVPNVQLIGNTLMTIDGCIGIKKYETDEIIIRSKDYLLKVCGECLSMLMFAQGRISIRGIISSYNVECLK